MSRHLRREDYTIGWLCALPIELAAAQEALDEEHETHHFDEDTNDPNIYILGSVAGHHVVIGWLPAGQIGTSSATNVASKMHSTFRGIRFVLMVGVGGGVPTLKDDIQLGDVVVSMPVGAFGGVVQYDRGKQTPSGFGREGSLNSPPPRLLSAVNRVRSDYLRGKSTFTRHISQLERNEKFLRSKAGADILFLATYNHKEGVDNLSCEFCRQDCQIFRQQREEGKEVQVHYGTIASGNTVMKDARQRDMVSKDLGGVLCFEMEAAGIMNQYPCLVVRGICDYADSHKNKAWQPYAAATAAAWTKDLLSILPKAEVAREETVQQFVRRQSVLIQPSSTQPRPRQESTQPPTPQRRPVPPLPSERIPNLHTSTPSRSYGSGTNTPPAPGQFIHEPPFVENIRQQLSNMNISNNTPGNNFNAGTNTNTSWNAIPPSHSQPTVIEAVPSQANGWSGLDLKGNLPYLKPKKFRDPETLITSVRSDSRFMKHVEQFYPSFCTFLRRATIKDIKPILEVLLRSGLNPNDTRYVGDYEDQLGANPHMWVLHKKWNVIGETLRTEIFKLLINHGADVLRFQMNNGARALTRAVCLGLRHIVLMLFNCGADVNDQTMDPRPLQVAVMYDQLEMIDLLVHHGAQVNAASIKWDQPIIVASYRGLERATMRLLQYGADQNARVTRYQDSIGTTPIMFATRYGKYDLVKHIAEVYRPELNAKAAAGWTALHFAIGHVQNRDITMCTKMCELLLHYGASPMIAHPDGNLPLHYAARCGLTQVVRALLQHGGREALEMPNTYNYTPVVLAAGNGHIDTLDELLRNGANLKPYSQGRYLQTALQTATQYQQLGMVLHLKSKYPHAVY